MTGLGIVSIRPVDPNPMVYNEGDQLVRWPGMYRYSYDGAGNLVEVKNDSQTQVLKSYTYTPAGLLATATYKDKDGNDRTLVNTWDANSNRVSFNASGTEYEFVYDPTASIPAVIEEATSDSMVYYIREPSGALIARLSATDGISYYHFDELGSTRLLTDADGNITDRYTYDAYGSVLSHDRYSGSVNQPYQYVGQLGYYTHYMEPDFGLMQLGVRFYDPEVGRFGQRDPVRTTRSSYLYCSGVPTRYVDALGTYGTDFYYKSDCKGNCPVLDSAIKKIIGQMQNSDGCRQAIKDVGCTWWFDKKLLPPKGTNILEGIIFNCYKYCEGKADAWTEPPGTIIGLNGCSEDAERQAAIIIHELVHACAFAGNGGNGPPDYPGYTCPQCGAVWKPGEGNPVWEGNAEKVMHACFPFTIVK